MAKTEGTAQRDESPAERRLRRKREQLKRLYDRRRAEGKCLRCEEPAFMGSTRCYEHLLLNRQQMRARCGHRPWSDYKYLPAPFRALESSAGDLALEQRREQKRAARRAKEER